MNKTTAILALSTVLLATVPAAQAHQGPRSSCEARLEPPESFENLVEEAVELETSLLGLEGICHGNRCLREAQNLRVEFNNYIEDLLNRAFSSAELLTRFSELTARELFLREKVQPRKTAEAAAPVPTRTILNFLEDPSQLHDGVAVTLGNEHNFIRSVTFADGVLFQFWELALHLQSKFLRSIFTGLVGPVGEAGVKPLSDIARHLVEVKIYGGGARLIGCLKGGQLTILRVVPDHLQRKGSLFKFSALCD